MSKSAELIDAPTISEVSKRLPAPEIIRHGLRTAIMNGDIAPGMQLRQDEIASRFGMSRIPVREALRQLAAEGLVELLPNRGAIVKQYTLEEIIEILEIRIGLETRALRLAVPNMAEEDIEAAAEILRRYDQEPQPERWSQMNWQFHNILYQPCNMTRMLSLIERNWNQSSRLVQLQVSLAAGKENPNREHWEILDACKQGKVENAAAMLERHIINSQKSLSARIRRQG